METSNKPKLPHSWVARIFESLTATYGREFSSKFESGEPMELPSGSRIDKGIALAMEKWREDLGGFADMPEAIAYALDCLPERAPNAIEFRNLCRNAPKKAEPLKLAHKFTDAEIAANKQKIASIVSTIGLGTGGLADLPTGAAVQQASKKSRVHPHWQRIVAGAYGDWGPFSKAKRCAQLAALRAYADANEPLPEEVAAWAREHGLGNELPKCQQKAAA